MAKLIKLPEVPAEISPELYRYFTVLYQNLFELEDRIVALENQVNQNVSGTGV